MTQNPQQPYQPSQEPYAPPQKSGVGKYLLIGCLGILIVSILVCAIGGFVAYKNARSIGASAVTAVARNAINESQMPADQKQRLISQIDQLGDDFANNNLTMEELGTIMERLVQSPVFQMGMVYFFEQQYVQKSGLTADEKAEARLTLERVARGMHEKTITQSEFETVTAPIMTTDASGDKQLKETLTDDELRAFLADAKKLADEKQIPNEPYKVDMASEFERIVQQVRSGQTLPDAESSEPLPANDMPAPATP